MAKEKEVVKTSKKETIEKIIKTVEVAIAPAVVAGAAIWGFDIGVYVAAVSAAIIAVLKCVEVFVKE